MLPHVVRPMWGVETLASGPNDSPVRKVPLKLLPRDGEPPCASAASSPSLTNPTMCGGDWIGPWVLAPCHVDMLFVSSSGERSKVHLLPTCRCVKKLYQFGHLVADNTPALHAETQCVLFTHETTHTHDACCLRPLLCDRCWTRRRQEVSEQLTVSDESSALNSAAGLAL